jgi:hypothetical protein
MTDDRFYERAGPFILADIAAAIGAEVATGAPADLKLRNVASLKAPRPAMSHCSVTQNTPAPLPSPRPA